MHVHILGICATIGLHAAGVTTIALLRDQTRVQRATEYSYLVGNYDGVIGWAAAIWFVLIILAFLWFGRDQANARADEGKGKTREK